MHTWFQELHMVPGLPLKDRMNGKVEYETFQRAQKEKKKLVTSYSNG